MKKIILILTILIMLIGNKTNFNAQAESRTFYAKVLSTGVELCSLPDEETGMFEIPYSYFVLVEQGIDDFFQVSYNGVSGYVKKENVQLMSGTPTTPYFKTSFNVVIPYYLYSSAKNDKFSASIDETVNLNFLGCKRGDKVTQDSDIWYYCYAEVENATFYGYVYSSFVYSKPTNEFIENSEFFDNISEEMLYPSQVGQFEGLSLLTKILLVVAIAIPSVLIIYFLIKPSKIMKLAKERQKSSNNKKQKKNVKRHGDYFEFDESDL